MADLPTDQSLEAITGAEITEENQDAIKEQLSFFTTFLLVFAIIAVIVGAFVIYNTFGILVAQRGRELALLRAIGASRRQVIGSVLVEASFVALVGSVAGLVGGIILAGLLRSGLNALGGELPEGPLVIEAEHHRGRAGAGLRRDHHRRPAPRVPGVAHPARSPPCGTSPTTPRATPGCGSCPACSSPSSAGSSSPRASSAGGDNALEAVGIGAGFVFLGVTVLGPVLVGPLVSVIGWPIARFRGMTGKLAKENTLRNPKRTSATAAALMIGVGLVGLITIAAASVSGSIDQAIDDSFTGDFVIDSGTFGFGGLSPDVGRRAQRAPRGRVRLGDPPGRRPHRRLRRGDPRPRPGDGVRDPRRRHRGRVTRGPRRERHRGQGGAGRPATGSRSAIPCP